MEQESEEHVWSRYALASAMFAEPVDDWARWGMTARYARVGVKRSSRAGGAAQPVMGCLNFWISYALSRCTCQAESGDVVGAWFNAV